ncbi:MAG: DNA polymerase III subunit gamma/tau [Mycoplasmataceae bacterium]|nr:DNA polymerase III subunit gamma/tau [Mycoplasmataceae bacterium]
MNYKALYRTYRPANFSEVEGQEHIVKTLVNLIKLKKISHAYLFSGPRGTGKTSVAKIFANVVNCGHNIKVEIACPSCIMTINNSVDTIEIDAASNNGINEIRELREKVKFVPTKFKYKIYIIDEVHMLTKGAFNALLKTLEEPPKHVIFILATTDPDKLPLTILSRVQRYNFKRINRDIIEKQLKFVFAKEKIKYEDGVTNMIAMLSNGSLRDALSIADQINAYSSSDIKLKEIDDIFGLTSKENQVLLLNYFVDNYVGLALKLFDELIDQGIDIQRLINSLIRLLKDHLLYQKTGDKSIIEEFDIEILNQIKLKSEFVYDIIDLLIILLNEIKYSDIPQQLFQITIIKICSLASDLQNSNFNTIKKNEVFDKGKESNYKEENRNISEITDNFIIKQQETNTNTNVNITDYADNPQSSITNEEVIVQEGNKEHNLFENKIMKDQTKIEKVDAINDDSFSKNNFSNEDKIIKEVTDILTLSNESNIDGDYVEGSILGQTDNQGIVYDTNEFSTKEMIEDKTFTNDTRKTESFNMSNQNKDEEMIEEPFTFNNSLEEENKYDTRATVLTQPDIINLFLLGDKQEVVDSKTKLSEGLLLNDEKYAEIISYLENCKIITTSKNFILMSSEDKASIDFLTLTSLTNVFKEFILEVFGKNKHFYAITKINFLDSAELFKELKSKDRLPEPVPLPSLPKVSVNNKKEKESLEAEKKGMDIFGKIFKRK